MNRRNFAILLVFFFATPMFGTWGSAQQPSSSRVQSVVGVAFDNSLSMTSSVELIKQAALQIVAERDAGTQMFWVRFVGTSNIDLMVPETKDSALLAAGVGKLKLEGGNQSMTLGNRTVSGLGGQTSILDALFLTTDKLRESRVCATDPCSRSLILVSDGEELRSYYSRKEVLKALKDAKVRVYAIGFNGALDDKTRPKTVKFLTTLATQNGGSVYFPKTNEEVKAAVSAIMADAQK